MSPKDESIASNGTIYLRGDAQFEGSEVAPSISVSTIFRHEGEAGPFASAKKPSDIRDSLRHEYSRLSQPTSARAERILSEIHGGYAITYASGIAASLAAMNFYQPKRVAITGGYHGVHAMMDTWSRGREFEKVDIDKEDFTGVDICWLETPLNPKGLVRNIQHYADKIHAVGGRLIVDATFGPPPLQDVFKWGADMIMHSGSKYLGGHSDLLCGVLVVRSDEDWFKLWVERLQLGNMMGSLESWLLLRSLRTHHLRIPRQSQNATALAQWLAKVAATPKGKFYDGAPGGIIAQVWHSSLQGPDSTGWTPEKQMTGGGSPTFAIKLVNDRYAKALPFGLKFFTNASSLGGVESLIEQRVRSSPGEDPTIVRISAGIEDVEDLKGDLRRVLADLGKTGAKL